MQLTARQREFAGIAGWALPVSVTPYCCLAANRSYVQLQTYALRCAPFAGQGRRLPTTRTGGRFVWPGTGVRQCPVLGFGHPMQSKRLTGNDDESIQWDTTISPQRANAR